MFAHVGRMGFVYFKVFGAVVSPIPIAVVHDFAGPQRASKHLLGN